MEKKTNRKQFLKACCERLNMLTYEELTTLYKGRLILDNIVRRYYVWVESDVTKDVIQFSDMYAYIARAITDLMLEENIKRFAEKNDNEEYF